LTDTSGTILARYSYDPYGRRTKVSGSYDADFGFTGHYYHAPSGLHLALYRAYDADTGRWLSRDPIGESGGLNLYGYVRNNPMSYVDPFGLAIFTEDFIGPMQPGDFVFMGGGNYAMMVGGDGNLYPMDEGLQPSLLGELFIPTGVGFLARPTWLRGLPSFCRPTPKLAWAKKRLAAGDRVKYVYDKSTGKLAFGKTHNKAAAEIGNPPFKNPNTSYGEVERGLAEGYTGSAAAKAEGESAAEHALGLVH
jgi:RHS repeat-associated protein